MIDLFRGQYAFLSNFYSAPVMFEGVLYSSSEAAFQAQKTLDRSERESMAKLSPLKAKKAGSRLFLRSDWEDIRLDIMYKVCLEKFTQNAELGQLLIATAGEELIEGNDRGDTFWGQVDGSGENHLGKILMRIRDELTNEYTVR